MKAYDESEFAARLSSTLRMPCFHLDSRIPLLVVFRVGLTVDQLYIWLVAIQFESPLGWGQAQQAWPHDRLQ